MEKCDIAIIGAGAAGMTAAIYALRAKKSVILIEKTTPGGQILLTNKLENYPGLPGATGAVFAENMHSQVKQFGGKIMTAEVLKISSEDGRFEIETDDDNISAGAVIIANGSRERKIGLPREEELTSHGVSYCATCDGLLYRDRPVAVYGGGNTAAYSAMYLAGVCSKVYWIFRKPEPRAEKHLVEKAKTLNNLVIVPNSVISALIGDDSLTDIELKTSGEQSNKTSLSIDGLFVTIGRESDNSRFKNLVELDDQGYIKSDETCTTSTPGVFCAGDTRAKHLHQLVTATADGAVAANMAIEYLNKNV
ncbi:FAD-dependent oxidoreductase [Candidatus Saccharibacteria bacterium]|nr:FAD-dependent oxidoreductase [Candidatus Saccharibacteria bacterium]